MALTPKTLIAATALIVAGGAIYWFGYGSREPWRSADRNPSCPHDAAFTLQHGRELVVDTVSIASVAGPIANIPEYHDCQRMLRGRSDVYGTLAGVYASWRLNDLVQVLDTLGGRAFPAAEIFAHDGPYPPLGILPLFNCLYVRRDTVHGTAQWRAWMVPISDDDNCSPKARAVASSAFSTTCASISTACQNCSTNCVNAALSSGSSASANSFSVYDGRYSS